MPTCHLIAFIASRSEFGFAAAAAGSMVWTIQSAPTAVELHATLHIEGEPLRPASPASSDAESRALRCVAAEDVVERDVTGRITRLSEACAGDEELLEDREEGGRGSWIADHIVVLVVPSAVPP